MNNVILGAEGNYIYDLDKMLCVPLAAEYNTRILVGNPSSRRLKAHRTIANRRLPCKIKSVSLQKGS